MASLILKRDGQDVSIKLHSGKNSIGRSRDNSIHLRSMSVSKSHAVIVGSEDGFFLEDLGSRNGTSINGREIHGCVPLNHGDTIRIGKESACFDLWESPHPSV